MMTCHYVEELLETVFEDYKKYLKKKNMNGGSSKVKCAYNKVESQHISLQGEQQQQQVK